jgi:hypothetical protein
MGILNKSITNLLLAAVVVPAGLAQTISVNPTQINFTYQVDSGYPSQTLVISAATPTPVEILAGSSDGCGWLQTNLMSGTTPMKLSVEVLISPAGVGLCASLGGTYTGSIRIYSL